MSQLSATQRRTAQILQHSAIVVAGMSSVGLTVAAATYAVNSSSVATSGRPGIHISTPSGPSRTSGTGVRAEFRPQTDTARPTAWQFEVLPAAGRFDLDSSHRALTVPFMTAAHDIAA